MRAYGWAYCARVWILLLFIGCAGLAVAQPLNSWTLHNASNQTLNFDTLDPARGTWKPQQIFPNQDKSFTMSPGVTTGKFRITTTGRGHVEYNVAMGGRYRLVWNQGKGVWDLLATNTAAPGNPPALPPPPVALAYELRNTSNQTLNFDTLDPARGTWKPQVIYPNGSKRMFWPSGGAVGKIRISTSNRGYVEYDIRAGITYNIVWDAAKGVWDVRIARSG